MARYLWNVKVLDENAQQIDAFTCKSTDEIYTHLKIHHPQLCQNSISALRRLVAKRNTKYLIFEPERIPPMTASQRSIKYINKIKQKNTEYQQILKQHNLI